MELDTDYTVSQEQLNEVTDKELFKLLAESNASLESMEETISSEFTVGDYFPSLESINSIVNEIRASGGICRDDVILLNNVTESMEGMSINLPPLNSFTEVPSKVNFDVSMENIVSDMANKVIETIKKIIAWIKEKLSNLLGMVKKSSIHNKQAEAVVETVTKDIKAKPKVTESTLKTEATKAFDAADNGNRYNPPVNAPKVVKEVVAAVQTNPPTPPIKAVKVVVDSSVARFNKNISDAMILMYKENFFDKSLGHATELENAARDFLQNHDYVRFVMVVSSTYENMGAAKMPADVAVYRIENYHDQEQIMKVQRALSSMHGTAMKKFGTPFRTHDLVVKMDPLMVMADLGLALEKHKKTVFAGDPNMTAKLVEVMSKQTYELENMVKREKNIDSLREYRNILVIIRDQVQSVVLTAKSIRDNCQFAMARAAREIEKFMGS
jgi:hypothetical protein